MEKHTTGGREKCTGGYREMHNRVDGVTHSGGWRTEKCTILIHKHTHTDR